MIKAKHHIFIYPLFQWLTRFLLKRNFNSVHIKGDFHDNGQPVLVIANHISWWDGFWMMYLSLKVLHRKPHFMMLEEQLRKHWYFRYTGAYSIKKTPKEIIKSLTFTQKLLENRRNTVFIFPQGKIHSLYNSIIHFEKGVQRIIDLTDDNLQVIYVANLLDYFCDTKPNLYTHIKQYAAKELKENAAEAEYNTFYTQILDLQKIKDS